MFTPIIYKCDTTGKIRTFQIEVEDDKYRVITGVKDGKQVVTKWTTCEAKNVGRSNATTPQQQAQLEALAKVEKKLAQNYYDNESDCKANPEKFFQVMLALEWEKANPAPELPLILDPKLDGMRMVTELDAYYSRKGKPIPTAKWIFEELEPWLEFNPYIVLDGEIYSHDFKSDFNELMSIARKTKPTQSDLEEAKVLQYHVYDCYNYNAPFMKAKDRKLWLQHNLPLSNRIKLVPYKLCTTMEEMKTVNQQHISEGYEGSIARDPNASYACGKRNRIMTKIKLFTTEEFTILGIEAGRGNRSDIAGKIFVDVDGIEVGCGIRGNWNYCKTLLENKNFYIGKVATIRHFGKTPDGSLRFPTCVDIDRPD